ncbi:MAG: hypothetical protein JWP12_1007 [Bacteroidetes bacterium]|nr:hypothetical protein [Bacteroidota bacterium]
MADFKIEIAKPCRASWKDMTAAEQGKFSTIQARMDSTRKYEELQDSIATYKKQPK